MARPKRTDVIAVEVSGALLQRLTDFHRASNLQGNVQDTARELIEAALHGVSDEALVHAARKRAYRQVSIAAYRGYCGLAQQLESVFRASLAQEEAKP